MPGRTVVLLCLTAALAMAAPAAAQTLRPMPIKVAAGPLGRTLQEIARQTGADLLYDRNLVVGRQAGRIDARMTAISAVRIALAGSDLNLRQAASGALIIEASAPAPLERQDVTVPELLVVGRRTQNADIRRQETDIQPYHIITADQVASAHVDNIGQFFDTRVTANTSTLIAGTLMDGSANSQIDLRGLGAGQTLVLIDGRRMPEIPGLDAGAFQADLNALPLHAVDRVEVLTGTAGGIYGFGALGGVVNVVLAHDKPGAEAHITAGISSRGDAGRRAFEGRLEFSPDRGATEVSLDVGFSRAQRLTAGQRDFLARDRRLSLQIDRTDFLNNWPVGDAVNVFPFFTDDPLVLKPAYGGASIGAPMTFLPSGFAGSNQALAAALAAHAGAVNLDLSPGSADTDLAATPKMASVLFNVRHQFGGGVEAYFDGIMLRNHGRYIDHGGGGLMLLSASSPFDPFEQDVIVSFPLPNAEARSRSDFDNARFTAGVLAPLPFGWRATAEATWGEARYRGAASVTSADVLFADDVNPFGSWAEFQAALLTHATQDTVAFDSRTRHREQSLRLAGPLWRLPGGPATLTLLVEHRTEDTPVYTVTATGSLANFPGRFGQFAGRSAEVTAIYAELRSRIFPERAPVFLLKGLEVQAAVRRDRQAGDFSTEPSDLTAPRLHVVASGVAYTFGAKITPTPWLLLRGSVATGQSPPRPESLVSRTDSFAIITEDPKRGGEFAFPDSARVGGSPTLGNVHATTISAGVVLTPFGPNRLQVSLDYSRIHMTGDVEFLDVGTVVDHEGDWPQRVQRGPLTDADQALGYTGGPITFVDATAINGGGQRVQTLDMRADWSFPVRWGWLHLYGAATYNFEDTRTNRYGEDLALNGYEGGPLNWRVSGGADWSLGSLTAGVHVQHLDSYFYNSPAFGSELTASEMIQGAARIPAQTYVDLNISKRFRLTGSAPSDVRVDLGVSNVLDASPPRVTALLGTGSGISPYGDPRRRRFELSVSALF